jgi:glutathione S-transferase
VTRQSPESKRIKAGINNLRFHLEYIDWIVERNNYLVGSELSLADISAAAQLSIIDYLGDVPWEDYKNAKLWYSKIKSRPSFKEILNDRIKGIYPSKHYENLDF